MNAVAINCMPIPLGVGGCDFDVPGPRYASYPTANRFVEAFTADQASQALIQRRHGAAAVRLSFALHVPFCEPPCNCSSNEIITQQHEHGKTYLHYLSREVDLYTASLGVGQRVSQLHLGVGTPTFPKDAELRELMAMLRRSFTLVPGGEYAVEIDPRTIDATRLTMLAELGFNQLSFKVQHFDAANQLACLMALARSLGFKSVNTNLIYGRPAQTPELFKYTLARIVQLRPDRLALHACSSQRPHHFEMLSHSLSVCQQAGYVHIGMGNFALPNDPLSIAKRQGRLHRNFKGYSTQPDCDQIGLGVSAIGRMGATYSQNARTLEAYCDCLDQGRLPVVQGLSLSRDDMVRRSVIMALMCHQQLEFESIDLGHLIDCKSYFAPELDALRSLQAQGLVEVSETCIQITEAGSLFVPTVVTVFDRYLQADHVRARFSRII